jgi:glycosyltransferase involved in cell wall biosynthesis
MLWLLVCCVGTVMGVDAQPSQPAVRILVGSPIRQKPQILEEFLSSLDRLSRRSYSLDFFFVDDNMIEESSRVLSQFQQAHGVSCHVEGPKEDALTTRYECNETTHNWDTATIWKVARFKERMIDYARNNGYDYLFLIDSDIVLHPNTINQLLEAHKDIISNVFWTKWYPNGEPDPQVWLQDCSTQTPITEGETLSQEEFKKRYTDFHDQLKKPGIYEVGGLGACTLISQHALQVGVSFKRMNNLSFWGEDRHFCVRAVALGLSLYVDTHLPACHVYRESALSGVAHYKWACEHNAPLPLLPTPRLTLSMVVQNEAHKYLRRVLEAVRPYIDDAVIIDDASTDASVEICREVLQGIPLHLVRNTESKFSNEHLLRKQQWEETAKQQPDWVLVLDADEIFEKAFERGVADLLRDNDVDVYFFRLHDMWNEWYYREDALWNAHARFAPFLVRYLPDVRYRWKETPQHCGRLPLNYFSSSRSKTSLYRIKHFGWASLEIRREKYLRYMRLDPNGTYGSKRMYESILDPCPNLVAWSE